jgi:hypothetical protein
MIDDPARLKHMATVKASLQTIYDGKIENLQLHIQDFNRHMQNTGLYKEFSIQTQENLRPVDINSAQWNFDHPLRWQTANFIENFNSVTLDALKQKKDCIDNTLKMLADVPESADDEGAPELASKQHCTWIAELLRNSWTAHVASEMASFEEETQGDGVLLCSVFLRETVGFTNEALIVVEQHLTKEKLALENFQYDITKFTAHVRSYIHQIIGAGLQPTKQHFILIFLALKEAEEAEFNLIIIQLYKEWRSGTGEGARLTLLQLLAKVNSEYKHLQQLGQWKTKNKTSDLLGLQAKFDTLQLQFQTLMAKHTKLKNDKPPPTSGKPTGPPKPEEKETCIVDGTTWYYCSTCYSGCRWNRTHKTAEHKRGAGKSKPSGDQNQQSHLAQMSIFHQVDGSPLTTLLVPACTKGTSCLTYFLS